MNELVELLKEHLKTIPKEIVYEPIPKQVKNPFGVPDDCFLWGKPNLKIEIGDAEIKLPIEKKIWKPFQINTILERKGKPYFITPHPKIDPQTGQYMY